MKPYLNFVETLKLHKIYRWAIYCELTIGYIDSLVQDYGKNFTNALELLH